MAESCQHSTPPSEFHWSPVIPLAIMVDGNCLRLFNTLTTFGTPQDVTLQELRIEMSFPADEATGSYALLTLPFNPQCCRAAFRRYREGLLA